MHDSRPTCKVSETDKNHWIYKDYDYHLTYNFNKDQSSKKTPLVKL